MTPQEQKAQANELLRQAVTSHAQMLTDIDPRLKLYMQSVARNQPDTHCVWEILGCLRWLRLSDIYEVDIELMHTIFRLIEGRWDKGRFIEGGLSFEGMRGKTHYRLTPFQVYSFTALFSLYCYVPTGMSAVSEYVTMAPSEYVNPDDGMVYDRRRLITDFIFFCPRKTGKTWFAAVVDVLMFMLLGDYNCEIAMCANSQDQSKILFAKFKELLRTLDPEETHIRMTATEINWKPGEPRACSATAFSAGGKKKDGFFAQVVDGDEYGSAQWVKERCDMSDLLNVMCSSMGPRREPLRLITTTAGHAVNGPFQQELDAHKRILQQELERNIA